MKEEIKIKAWAVMFSPELIERMVAQDNKIWFSPYCIFKTRNEAKEWIEEKWIGGYQGSKGSIQIRRCEIKVASNQL